jgi:uncharacterized protein (DUF433 family)
MSHGKEDVVASSNVTVLALSADNIIKLTGLTMRQLAYWDKTGFFKPEFASTNRRSPHSRVYSFQDAVGLRTISILLNAHRVSVPHLREVAEKLSAYTSRPWSDLKLRVWKRKVQFDEPETGATRDVVDGQYFMLPIIDVIEDLENKIGALKTRDLSQAGQFEKRKHISHNQLVIAGTRIPVQSILEYVEDGYSTAEILKQFPLLTKADVEAVVKNGKSAIAA